MNTPDDTNTHKPFQQESRNDADKRYVPCIVVHAGAGSHAISRTSEYARLLRSVVNASLTHLVNTNPPDTCTPNSKCAAEKAVVCAIKMLETSPLTNAGIFGSNLTINGSVECDAAIMISPQRTKSPAFGAVGAMPMTHPRTSTLIAVHPIQVAATVMHKDAVGRGPAGRVPPVLVAGENVHDIVHDTTPVGGTDIEFVSVDQARTMITDRQRQRFTSHMSIFSTSASNQHINHTSSTKHSSDQHHDDVNEVLCDTVGAVAIDMYGNICAGVSSGGISLKYPGRIGEAAVFGAGIWTQSMNTYHESTSSRGRPGIGISVSGTGEHIIKIQVASRVSETITESLVTRDRDESSIYNTIKQFMMKEVVGTDRIDCHDTDRSVGFVCLVVDPISNHGTEYFSDQESSDDDMSKDEPSPKRHCVDERLRDMDRPMQEVWWAHTTKTMCLAYGSVSSPNSRPHFIMSKMSDASQKVVVSGCSIR